MAYPRRPRHPQPGLDTFFPGHPFQNPSDFAGLPQSNLAGDYPDLAPELSDQQWNMAGYNQGTQGLAPPTRFQPRFGGGGVAAEYSQGSVNQQLQSTPSPDTYGSDQQWNKTGYNQGTQGVVPPTRVPSRLGGGGFAEQYWEDYSNQPPLPSTPFPDTYSSNQAQLQTTRAHTVAIMDRNRRGTPNYRNRHDYDRDIDGERDAEDGNYTNEEDRGGRSLQRRSSLSALRLHPRVATRRYMSPSPPHRETESLRRFRFDDNFGYGYGDDECRHSSRPRRSFDERETSDISDAPRQHGRSASMNPQQTYYEESEPRDSSRCTSRRRAYKQHDEDSDIQRVQRKAEDKAAMKVGYECIAANKQAEDEKAAAEARKGSAALAEKRRKKKKTMSRLMVLSGAGGIWTFRR